MIKMEGRKYYIFLIFTLLISNTVWGQKPKKHKVNPVVKALDYFNKGSEKAKDGKYAEAIPYFDKAIKLDNTNYESYYNRGYCEVHLDDYEGAIPDFTK